MRMRHFISSSLACPARPYIFILSHKPQAGRSRVRFPMVSLEFFIDIILPATLWLWGLLSLYHTWVPEIFPGGGGLKTAGAKGWQHYHLHVPTVLKFGSLNPLQHSGPVQAYTEIDLPLSKKGMIFEKKKKGIVLCRIFWRSLTQFSRLWWDKWRLVSIVVLNIYLPGKTEENHNKRVQIAGALTDIRIGHLPKKSRPMMFKSRHAEVASAVRESFRTHITCSPTRMKYFNYLVYFARTVECCTHYLTCNGVRACCTGKHLVSAQGLEIFKWHLYNKRLLYTGLQR
jgi:hypothetical protein